MDPLVSAASVLAAASSWFGCIGPGGGNAADQAVEGTSAGSRRKNSRTLLLTLAFMESLPFMVCCPGTAVC